MTDQATVERPVLERDPRVAELRDLLVSRHVATEGPVPPPHDTIDAPSTPERDDGAPGPEQEIGQLLFNSYLQAVVATLMPPSERTNGDDGLDTRPNGDDATPGSHTFVPERVEVMNAVLDPSYFPAHSGPGRVPSARAVVAAPRHPPLARTVAWSTNVGLPYLRRSAVHVEDVAHRFTTTAFVRADRRSSTKPTAPASIVQSRRHRRLATGFAWVQNVGAILILFAGWQIWGTTITEHHAQSSLKAQFEAEAHKAPAPVAHSTSTSTPPVTLLPASTQLPNPPEGSVVGHIQIPAIGVNQYVVSGTAEGDLAKGPGHYVGTALPGQAGNVDIAGHRTTYGAPFYDLGQLVAGDPIELTTVSGETLTYVVTGPPTTVSPSDTAILGYFGDNRLTLTTCTPPFSASHRLVVVASLRLPGPAASPEKLAKVAPKPYKHVASSDTASWGWGSLPPALAALAILVGLGLMHRRMKRSVGRVGQWIVLAPIWIAGLYLLFESLSGLLPASV